MKKLFKLPGLFSAIILFILAIQACSKPDHGSGNYLKLSHGMINVTNTIGSQHGFSVQSNIKWHLSISPAATDWIVLSKANGFGNENIIATAAKDNPEKIIKRAEIIASAVDDPSVKPVQLLIIQNDTTIVK